MQADSPTHIAKDASFFRGGGGEKSCFNTGVNGKFVYQGGKFQYFQLYRKWAKYIQETKGFWFLRARFDPFVSDLIIWYNACGKSPMV